MLEEILKKMIEKCPNESDSHSELIQNGSEIYAITLTKIGSIVTKKQEVNNGANNS